MPKTVLNKMHNYIGNNVNVFPYRVIFIPKEESRKYRYSVQCDNAPYCKLFRTKFFACLHMKKKNKEFVKYLDKYEMIGFTSTNNTEVTIYNDPLDNYKKEGK